MSKISHFKGMDTLLRMVLVVAAAKILSLILLFSLPAAPEALSVQKNYTWKYHKYDFGALIEKEKKEHATTPGKQNDTHETHSIAATDILLRGIYATSSGGYAILAKKEAPQKSDVVAVKENYHGYTLVLLNQDSAVFEKEDQSYVVKIDRVFRPSGAAKIEVKEYDTKKIARSTIQSYGSNPADIWKDIAIVEVKNGEKIEGFKVTRIDPKSKVAATGLQKGDVILSCNNVAMDSYQNAIDLYANIDAITTLKMEILRENQTMEIIYEID